MRNVFLAINLPQEQKKTIAAFQKELLGHLPGVKWVPEENLHLTLVFFGHLAPEEKTNLCSVLQNSLGEIESFHLEPQGLGVFPSIRRPRVIWVGLVEERYLRLLNQSLFRILTEAGFRLDLREFSPHITLGRVKEKTNKEILPFLMERNKERRFARFSVTHVDLMESELKKAGPLYHLLVRFPLREKGER
jgi:2'-5' RNA ligase